MAKVKFELNDEEENNDIQLIINRHKLAQVLYDLSDFYRRLYNGKLYTDELITVKDNKVLTQEDYDNFTSDDYPLKDTKSYISTDYLEQELDNILHNVRYLIDY